MSARDSTSLLGVVHGMGSADYHAIEALGASGLRKLARSPRHFFAAHLDPNRPSNDPTPSMRAGTLAHCAVLEPEALALRYIVKPPGHDGRTKEGKAWVQSVAPGFEIVTADEWTTAQRQADAVRALPEIAALLVNGHPEVSAFVADEETGVLLKARPDWVSPCGDHGALLVDVKTTSSANPKDFARTVVNFGYAMQAAHYCDVYGKASGQKVLGFLFAAVEADWPHVACAYMLPDEWLDTARAERRRLIDLYAQCCRTGVWPGYSEAIELLQMPKWLVEAV